MCTCLSCLAFMVMASLAGGEEGWYVSCMTTDEEDVAQREVALLNSLGFGTELLWCPDWSSLDGYQGWMVCAGPLETGEEASATAFRLLWRYPDVHGLIVHDDGFSQCIAEPQVSVAGDLAGLCPPLLDLMCGESRPYGWKVTWIVLGPDGLEERERPLLIDQTLSGWRIEVLWDDHLGTVEMRSIRLADPDNRLLFPDICEMLRVSAPVVGAEVLEEEGEYILLHRLPNPADRCGDWDFWAALSGDSIEYGYRCRTFYGEMPYSWTSIPDLSRTSLLPVACVNWDEALDILQDRLLADGATPSNPGGISWNRTWPSTFTRGAWRDCYDVEVREVHPEGGAGDPSTAPVLERFRVYARTGEILWYAMPEGLWVPYREYLSEVAGTRGFPPAP